MISPARPQLRGYQVSLVQRLRDSFASWRRVLCVLPTGGGKTVAAAWLIDSAVAKGRRVLFLAHRAELIEQASAKLDAFGVPNAVIKAGHARQDLSLPVQVASVQTMVRRLDRLTSPTELDLWGGVMPESRRPFDLIVVDEAHHTCAGSYVKILQAYPDALVLGLTATPYRMDGKGLGDWFDALEIGAHVSQLIGDGWLVRTRSFAPPPPEELDLVKVRAGEFSADAAANVLNVTGPLAEIVGKWKQLAEGRTTVAFACTVKHAQAIATAFRDAGVAAAAIDGDAGDDRRDQVLADLAAGRLQVVANCQLLTEGWDLPACSCVVLARPTRSRALWRQMVGRGMRSAPGKTDCVILDHAGNVHRFGTPDEDDHYSLRDDTPDEAQGIVVCPACHALVDGGFVCHECGCIVGRSGAGQADDDGDRDRRRPGDDAGQRWHEREAADLTEQRPMSDAERRLWYHALLTEADARGYKSGWAAHRYKERFGRWPLSQWAHEPREIHA